VVIVSIVAATSSHKKAKPANASAPTTSTPTTSAPTTSTPTTKAAVPVVSKPSCVGGGGYGGIGASVAAFKKQNPTAGMPPPPSYGDGLAYYEIQKVVHGCVAEYTITEATTPPQSSRDLLFLVGGIGLPGFPPVVVDQNACEVWNVKALQKAVGLRYAVGFVQVPPQGDATGIVDMSASARPSC